MAAFDDKHGGTEPLREAENPVSAAESAANTAPTRPVIKTSPAPGLCPACGSPLLAATLTCTGCETQLTGSFSLGHFSVLTPSEQQFVLDLLEAEGNLKAVGAKQQLRYPKLKERLRSINVKLGLRQASQDAQTAGGLSPSHPAYLDAIEGEHFIITAIKQLLNDHGGEITIPLISEGKNACIQYACNGTGLTCDRFWQSGYLTFEDLIAAWELIVLAGGSVYKGYARQGRLCTPKLPPDSLEGYLAWRVHHVAPGEIAFSPGFVIAAVLARLGLVENRRSAALWVNPKNGAVTSYQEAFENAIHYADALPQNPVLQRQLADVKVWYYFPEANRFAPLERVTLRGLSPAALQSLMDLDALQQKYPCHPQKTGSSETTQMDNQMDENIPNNQSISSMTQQTSPGLLPAADPALLDRFFIPAKQTDNDTYLAQKLEEFLAPFGGMTKPVTIYTRG